MSEETLRKLAMQVRNWGRWGPTDEIGTLNFITPDAVAGACRLARAGKVFALGIPLQREGPQSGTRQRFNPIHTMFRDGGDAPRTAAEVTAMQGYGGSDDWIVMPLQCATQWDSLAHVHYDGKLYNGFEVSAVVFRCRVFSQASCRQALAPAVVVQSSSQSSLRELPQAIGCDCVQSVLTVRG